MDVSDKKRGRPWIVTIPEGKEGERPCNFCNRDEEKCHWKVCAAYRQWVKCQWEMIRETFKPEEEQ